MSESLFGYDHIYPHVPADVHSTVRSVSAFEIKSSSDACQDIDTGVARQLQVSYYSNSEIGANGKPAMMHGVCHAGLTSACQCSNMM